MAAATPITAPITPSIGVAQPDHEHTDENSRNGEAHVALFFSLRQRGPPGVSVTGGPPAGKHWSLRVRGAFGALGERFRPARYGNPGRGSAILRYGICWKQATSYCETACAVLAFDVPPGPVGLPGFPAQVLLTDVLNGEPLALTDPPGPGPTLPVLQEMPWFEPGCPGMPVTRWGFAARAAEEIMRQALTAMGAMRYFTSDSCLKTVLNTERSDADDQRSPANATWVSRVSVVATGLRAGAGPVKSGRGAQDERLIARNVPKASMTNELVCDQIPTGLLSECCRCWSQSARAGTGNHGACCCAMLWQQGVERPNPVVIVMSSGVGRDDPEASGALPTRPRCFQ